MKPGSKRNAACHFKAARAGAFSSLKCGDGAEAAGIDLHVGWLVVAMVKDVGRLHAELEPGLLVECDALHEGEREVGHAGAYDAAHRGIAEAADSYLVWRSVIESEGLVRKRIRV